MCVPTVILCPSQIVVSIVVLILGVTVRFNDTILSQVDAAVSVSLLIPVDE